MRLLVLVFLLLSCTQIGRLPDNDALVELRNSRNYDPQAGVFVNLDRGVVDRLRAKRGLWTTFTRWLFTPEGVEPERTMPEGDPALAEFALDDGRLKMIWVGHSTILLNIDGVIILFDPVFSNTASPFPFMVKRFQKPSLKLESLPDVDYIFISHDHYDHLDQGTVKHFKDSQAHFFVPLGVGSHLRYWDVPAEKITELDWWDERTEAGLRFVAAPAQHWSGRMVGRRNRTLWASWIVIGRSQRIYFSGDTGYNTHLKEIGDKWGTFDVAFIDSGQYNTKWAGSHILPRHFVQAFKDLRAELYFPIHWAMFNISVHPWQEPADRLQDEADTGNINLITPKLGELVVIGEEYKSQPWWRNM